MSTELAERPASGLFTPRGEPEAQLPAMLEPGIYHDLPFDQYRALPYLSQSILKLMDRDEKYGATAKHAKAAFDGRMERADTETLRLGRAEHCWIVEGEEQFRERYIVAPSACEAIKKGDGQRCTNKPTLCADGHWFCGTKGHAPEGAATPADYLVAGDVERIREMAESVRQHEACQFLRRKGWSEATIIYDVAVPVTLQRCRLCGGQECLRRLDGGGFRCRICGKASEAPEVDTETVTLRHKVRLDRLAEPDRHRPHLIVDLKRMQLMSGRRIQRFRTIQDYGWDFQGGNYTEGVEVHFGVSACDFAWVFVEEKYPHDVAWFQASEDTLRIGRDKLHRCRAEWAKCQLLNRWDGYCRGNQPHGGLTKAYVREYFKNHGDSTGRLRSDVLATA